MSMYNMKATGCTTAFRFWLFGLTSSWFLQEHKGFQNSGLKDRITSKPGMMSSDWDPLVYPCNANFLEFGLYVLPISQAK